MKKIISLSVLLFCLVIHLSGQNNENSIFLGPDGVITIGGDSGVVITSGYDTTSADSAYQYEDPSSSQTNTSKVYQVEEVPNPKEINNTYVSDPDHYLQPETIAAINNMLASLEAKTTDQVAVVVLNSIGGEIPKTFAYTLFNKWGIGIRGKDNGLLILMVMDQRRVEFETGYGMESMLPDAICKRIQMKYMVPEFKNENYDKGLLEGVKATYDILSNPENSKIASELKEDMHKETQEEKLALLGMFGFVYSLVILIFYISKRKKKQFKQYYQEGSNNYYKAISHRRWLTLYVFIPLFFSLYIYYFSSGDSFAATFFVGCYLILLLFFLEKRFRLNQALAKSASDNHYENYVAFKKSQSYWWIAALFFPFVFIFYMIYVQIKKKAIRNHPRNCRACQAMLRKLDEKEDDQYLKKTQILEEGLRSIDYDVWLCANCGDKEIYAFANSFSKYSACRKCSVVSSYLYSDRTIESATYSSTGTGCKTYKCKNCSYVREETYTIAMKTSSSDSSGSGGGGGSSFGGGSSGGGGSGSSW